jgi:hypothetical protein
VEEAIDEAGPRRSKRIRDGAKGGYQDITTKAVALKAHRLEGAPLARESGEATKPFLPAELLRSLARGCNLPEDAMGHLAAASPVIADVD